MGSNSQAVTHAQKEQSGIASFFGGLFDGGCKIVGLQGGAINSFSERVGAIGLVSVGAIALYGRLGVKPALEKAPNGEAILQDIKLSGLAIGSLKKKKKETANATA